LKAMGTTVGLKVILKSVPAVEVDSDLDGLPFRQAWDLLINTYGEGTLDYVVLDNDVVLVGPRDVVARSTVAKPVALSASDPRIRKLYPVNEVKLAPFLTAEIPGITVTEVPGQKVLAITGTAAQQVEVGELLTQLDRPVVTLPTILKTYSVGNATSIAAALREVSDLGVKIVADDRSNTVIALGTADQQAQIERLIPTLDKKNRNVRVKMRIQTIDSGSGNDLGFTLGALKTVTPTNDTWSVSTGAGLLGGILNLFDATSILTRLNLNATLNALDSQGLSKTLDQTEQLVEGNGVAQLSSGGKIIVAQATGDKIAFQEFPFGTFVSVKPRISPEGNIVLTVTAKVGGEPVAVGLNYTIKEKSIVSTFTIAPGQYVIMGGLTTDVETSNVAKFPILGDIPIIGSFFSRRKSDTSQNQLLFSISADLE
jgi:type IV pilus assembly protein PilQ